MSDIQRRWGRIAPWWRRFKRNGYHLDRCDHCGHRFRWSRDARHGDGGSKHWHGPCSAYLHWRRKADDRLAVLALVMDLSELTERDVKFTAEFRADGHDERVAMSNQAFGVFYDLAEAAPAPTTADPS